MPFLLKSLAKKELLHAGWDLRAPNHSFHLQTPLFHSPPPFTAFLSHFKDLVSAPALTSLHCCPAILLILMTLAPKVLSSFSFSVALLSFTFTPFIISFGS